MPDLAELQPRNPIEEHEAARAVHETRKLAEGDELIESLTDRERLLVEHAWEAGASQARADLKKKLTNPQASTLDADRVASVLNAWDNCPIVFRPASLQKFPGDHYTPSLVSVVRQAFRRLQEGEGHG